MPLVNWQQQGSFEIPELPPTTEPDEGPFVCLPPINRFWLPYVMGALDQLRNPSAWLVADDAAMYTTLARVTKLREMLGVGTPCMNYQLRFNGCILQYSTDFGSTWTAVDGWDGFCSCAKDCTFPIGVPPVPPGGPTGDQLACNIADYLAVQIVQLAIQKQLANFSADNTLFGIANELALVMAGVGFVWTAAFVEGAYIIWQAINAGTEADFSAAVSDPTLWDQIRCCIYSAIVAEGLVTSSNFAAITTCICAISYTHAEVITAICSFITALGYHGLAELQQAAGTNANADCSFCSGGWCWVWEAGGINTPAWSVPSWYSSSPTPPFAVASGAMESVTQGTNEILYVQQNFSSTYISSAEAIYYIPNGIGTAGGAAFNRPDGSGWSLPNATGFNHATQAINETLTGFGFQVDSQGVGHSRLLLTKLVLRGPGTSPFGGSNC